MKKGWELLAYSTGTLWHDRQGDTECDRVEIRTPYGISDAPDASDAERLAQERLGELLGDVKRYPAKKTRARVRDWKKGVLNFDFQYNFRGGVWVVSFRTRSESLSAASIVEYLDGID